MSDKNGAKDSIFARNKWLNIRGELRALDRPWVMGILNITPDSFYDGGEFLSTGDAIAQAEKMLHEGADIIDLGASSTRPGAKKIPASEEINRLKPMLKEIRQKFPDAVISVDTYQADVARAAADLGADMINDISGGTLDPSMPETIGDLGAPLYPYAPQRHPGQHAAKSALSQCIEGGNAVFFRSIRVIPGPRGK
ncbi:MAG: dihydropteroate synthase [Owenweeksia sp.]|nr:dihydropteroate synthase [Owenweeksia sp.]